MFYKDWIVFYKKIAKDFDYKLEKEEKAAKTLNDLLKKNYKNLLREKDLKELIWKKEVVIFGAGPNLEKDILKNKDFFDKKIKITADGATTALLENKISPDIIVTDLDGKISDQIQANKAGCKTIIHTHGDNISRIKKYVPMFQGEILGTTQICSKKYELLHNYGGFTDGDRAVFISDHFQAKRIYLSGFYFEGRIGEYSFAENKDKILKMKKLKWCKKLIDTLKEKNSNIEFLSS